MQPKALALRANLPWPFKELRKGPGVALEIIFVI